MTFTPKNWQNFQPGSTPLTGPAMIDLETRVTNYSASFLTETWTLPSTLFVVTGQGRYYFPAAAAITSVTASVGTAPTGASVICDVNKNGNSIFSTQANRPTISATGFVSSAAIPDVTAYAQGDYLTVDVDQVGSTIPGSDLSVQVLFS